MSRAPRKLCPCGSTDLVTLQMTMRDDIEMRSYKAVCIPCALRMVTQWQINLAEAKAAS